MVNCIFIGIGGFIGSILRYLVGQIPLRSGEWFPVQTLLINVVGAFMIGVITALSVKNQALSPRMALLLKVGVCGGFTTFSTFAYESVELFTCGRTTAALLYVFSSFILGCLAILVGQLIVK